MRRFNGLYSLALVCLLLACASTVAGEEDFSTKPVGVFDIVYEGGEVVRLHLKGEATISSALSGSRANRQARDGAIRDAKSFFSKWLNEDVTIVELAEEIVLLTEKDGVQSGTVVDRSSTTFQSISENLIRGLIVLQEDGDGEVYTIIMGWSKKLNDGTAAVGEAMKNPGDEAESEDRKSAQSVKKATKVKRGAGNTDDF